MENKETILKLEKVEDMTSKAGRKFCKVNGEYSVFEKDIIDELKERIGQEIKVEIAESDNGFKNIRKFKGSTNGKVNILQAADNFSESRAEKNKSMYVSYAKDVFLQLNQWEQGREQEKMSQAIALIQQAIKAFN